MNTRADKTQENKSQSIANEVSQKQNIGETTFQFIGNHPEAISQRNLQEVVNNSPQVLQLRVFQEMANNSPQVKNAVQLQAMADKYIAQQQPLIQKKKNNTGFPDNLKSGIENLSVHSTDDIKVHYNSVTQLTKVNLSKAKGKEGTIISITDWPRSRRGNSLSSGQGDHTTAYTTFKSMVSNKIIGKTPDEASVALQELLYYIETLPGMQINSPAIRVVYRRLERARLRLSCVLYPSEPEEKCLFLAEAADLIVSARNSVPKSSMKVKSSSGGHGENVVKYIDLMEFFPEKMNIANKNDALKGMITFFDYSPKKSEKGITVANVILQHIISMELTYPRLYELLTEKQIIEGIFMKMNLDAREDGEIIKKWIVEAVKQGVGGIEGMGKNPQYNAETFAPMIDE